MDPELEAAAQKIEQLKAKKKPKAGKTGIMFDSANHELEKKKKTEGDSSSETTHPQ